MVYVHKTGRAPVWKAMTDVDPTTVNTTSTDILNPQMLADEVGTWQAEIDQAPGAGTQGGITLEGRLSHEAPFVIIDTILWADFVTAGALSIVVPSVPMLKDMQIAFRDVGAGYNKGNVTQVSVWVME